MRTFPSIEDLRQVARRKVPRAFFEYVDSGSYNEETFHANRADLAQIKLRQRVLVDVSERSTASTILGQKVSAPFALAPIGLCGMLTPQDPRWVSTVAAVEQRLLRSGKGGVGVYRYFSDDGVAGVEGSFLLCLGWLIEAQASLGRRDEAMASYDALLALQPDHKGAADNRRRLLAQEPGDEPSRPDYADAPAISPQRLRRDLTALEDALQLQDCIRGPQAAGA